MKKFVSKLFVVSVALMICSSVCLSQQNSSSAGVPKGWKKVNAYDLFTFYLPPSAWVAAIGFDSYSKEYRIGKLALKFEYHKPMGSILAYENREKKFGKGFQESVIEINGRKTYMFSYSEMLRGSKRYYTEIYVGDLPNGQVKLWMRADSWRQADLEIAEKIFGTVEFLKP